MKKIIYVLSLLFFVSGCSVNYDNLVKVVDTLQERANMDFKEFKINGEYTVNNSKSKYELLKDNDNYFIKIDNDYSYIIKNNNSYYIYSCKDNIKTYEISDDDINDILDSYFSEVDINVSIKETYINISDQLRNYFNRCNSNDEIVSCDVNKKIFDKYDIKITIQGDNNKRVNTYLIKRGKIASLTSEYTSTKTHIKTILEYDYSDQKIKNFNKSEHKRKSS